VAALAVRKQVDVTGVPPAARPCVLLKPLERSFRDNGEIDPLHNVVI
jgi:hypothetical protein